MKHFDFSILCSFVLSTALSFMSKSQTHSQLSHNQMLATIHNNSPFLKGQNGVGSGYKIIGASGLNQSLIYTASFWFGGKDVNGQLKMARSLFSSEQSDFLTGPFSTNYSYQSPQYQSKFSDMIWVISEEEILNHINNFSLSNYVMPISIQLWPANGDSSLGVSSDLAPYVDVDNNGLYNPENGDYPLIKGQKAIYTIMNDNVSGSFEMAGEPIGLEYHLMAYQYSSNDFLDSTTFIELRTVNRGTQTLIDFRLALFLDYDLGDPLDDFVGSNPDNNLIYVYNASNNDAVFGDNPPALGVVLLNKDIDVAGYFNALGTGGCTPGINDDPVSSEDFYRYMNGVWRNFEVFKEGGLGHGAGGAIDGSVATHLFPGNPNNPNEWSEFAINNPPGDRRGFLSCFGDVFFPGTNLCHQFALIYDRSGNHIENVSGLIQKAQNVQLFYNNELANFDCLNYSNLGIQGQYPALGHFNIFPNPASTKLYIDIQDIDVELVKIFSSDGVLVNQQIISDSELLIEIDTSNWAKGLYIVQIGALTKRLIID